MKLLRFPNKRLRAKVLAQHYFKCGNFAGVVCFSCGNASKALKDEGLPVVDISPSGDLEARKWFGAADIQRAFPNFLDATSGHLPPHLLKLVAAEFRAHLGELDGEHYAVPTGSGETLLALCMAYPQKWFSPVYDDSNPATTYEPEAPLNALVLRASGAPAK